MGLALAAEYDAAGIDYLLVARGAQLARLRDRGLDYERPEGRRTVHLAVTDAENAQLRPDDLLVLAVKTQDVEAATAFWADQPVAGGGVGADLPILTLQNGLEAERIAARRFARVYSASVGVPAVYVETGKVSVLSGPEVALVLVGRFPAGRDATTARIVADLTRANSLAEEREDIGRWKAAKLLHNVKNVVELFAGDPDALADAGRRLSAEAETVLRAAGLDPARPEERRVDISHWRVLIGETRPGGQSTWQSFVRGARSEVDYLNGEIARLALIHGLAAPWSRAAQRLAAELARSGGKPGDLPIARLTAAAAPAEPAPAESATV